MELQLWLSNVSLLLFNGLQLFKRLIVQMQIQQSDLIKYFSPHQKRWCKRNRQQ